MAKIVIQVQQKPPKKAQLDAVKNRMHLQARLLLGASISTGIAFLAMYAFDNPPTGKAAKEAGTRAIDWWMAVSILVALGTAMLYTKLQFSLQLLQPITKDAVKAIQKLAKSQPKIGTYIGLVDKEGRDLIEAESKTCILYAQGMTEYSERI